MKCPRVAATTAVLASAIVLAACAGREERPSSAVTIAAAADLRYALEELTVEFGRQHPAVPVTVSYGSSGTFFAQLQNGAPFDVFLSADVSYPRQLAANGLTVPGSEFKYAEGRIVVWALAASRLDVASRRLDVLTDPAVTHVAIANPEHAPYGRAAESAMRTAGLLDLVKPKLVFGENVSQALQFVQSGAAEAGIVALSLAVAPAVDLVGQYWLIPADSHPPLEQAGTIMRSSKNIDGAHAFRAFMLSDAARALLSRYGFATPSAAAASAGR